MIVSQIAGSEQCAFDRERGAERERESSLLKRETEHLCFRADSANSESSLTKRETEHLVIHLWLRVDSANRGPSAASRLKG